MPASDSASCPISLPAGFAPGFALGYADTGGDFALVRPTAPLPVQIMDGAPATAPPPTLEGTATGVLLAGPFAPAGDAPVHLSLWGDWMGTVQLERAASPTSPHLPTTAAGAVWGRFTANACEQVWSENEAGAVLYLAIAVTSGTLHYRVVQ